ncbi:S-layer homology domain-containing protein [Paenibacillus rigui]|uniref:SLH domain-containing protein n=1 Tax=Paenibacillus rigui TaxID=554312 RepID=A0A229UQG2_9BACL|nr:S-layer homology domain-containing protein [Paenibacillus rigui]OXM85682.1 hypothetical protein CF651_13970 [Paenibacillus rigui]
MLSDGQVQSWARIRLVLVYTLLVSLLATVWSWSVPAKVHGAGAAFSSFQVTTEAPPLYSGYYLGPDNYSVEKPVYHYSFTAQDSLAAGDSIHIVLPYQYNFTGNPNFYGLWTTGQTVPAGSIVSTVNGSPLSLFGSVTTEWSADGHPMLSFPLNQPVAAGAAVDIKLSGFLITPDYHRKEAGPEDYAISTASNDAALAAQSNIYFRSVMNFRPDADTYAASAHTAYLFGFTVMQPIHTTDLITLKFPAEISLPAAITPSDVQIDGVSVASVTVNGDQLVLQPSQLLPSYANAMIRILASAMLLNPSTKGYYSFELATSVDPLSATGRIGIVPADGGSLADNPSSDEGYVEVDSDGRLRFRFTSPTILKGGDTVTIVSPEGTVLSDPAVSTADVQIEPGMVEAMDILHPSSLSRPADNKLQFVLPANYYLAPDYSIIFYLPNKFAGHYGQYPIQVMTSQTVKPNTVPLLIAPSKVQQFGVTPASTWAGEANAAYTFTLKPNVPLAAANGDYVAFTLPSQLQVPAVVDPMSMTATIDPNLVLVNGVPAKAVKYISFSHTLTVAVPQDIPLLGAMEITVSAQAGWTNPAPGTYTFSVYPNWYSDSLAEAAIEYKTGISAAPGVVSLQLGGTVSRQLAVTEHLADGTTRDVTSAASGTIYSSGNTSVATVTADGLIEAKQEGQTTVTIANGSSTAAVQVTVAAANAPQVTGITAVPATVQLQLGGAITQQQLTVKAQLSDGAEKDVTSAVYGTAYESSDASVATVTADGLIRAKQAGQAVITATNSVYQAEVNVTVAGADVPPASVKVTGITAVPATVQLQLGGVATQQLAVKAQLSDGTEKDVTSAVYGTAYRSSDASVATVTADGLVQAKQAGQTVITVTNSVYTAAVSVTVNPASQGSGRGKHSGSSSTGTAAASEGTGTGSASEVTSVEKGFLAAVGGVLELPAKATITIPAGALQKDGTVKASLVKEADAPSFAGKTNLGPIVEFTSSTGTNLNKPMKLSISYDTSRIGTGLKPAIYYYNKKQARWIYIGGTADANGTITVDVNHFGLIAVFPAEQPSFSDMNGHWASMYVDRLVGLNVVHGFEDRTFRPDQPVTRAQLVKLISDALVLPAGGQPDAFADRDTLPAWAKDAIAQAVQAGVIQGYQEKGAAWFKPSQELTRAELTVILSRALELGPDAAAQGSGDAAQFSDGKDIPGWALDAVHKIAASGIVTGYPDGSFRPQASVTRAEAAKMIYMLLESLHR